MAKYLLNTKQYVIHHLNLSPLTVHDEGYSRNVSFTLKLDIYNFIEGVSCKKKLTVILANIGKPAVNDVDDAKPGPSRMETQSQKRPVKNVNYR